MVSVDAFNTLKKKSYVLLLFNVSRDFCAIKFLRFEPSEGLRSF